MSVQYTVTVHGCKPWIGLYKKEERKRWDALILAAQRLVYEVLHNRAMLDKQSSHDLMNWLETLPRMKPGHLYSRDFLGGDFTLMITERRV